MTPRTTAIIVGSWLAMVLFLVCLIASCAHVDPGTYCLPHSRFGGDTCVISDGEVCRVLTCDDSVCLEQVSLQWSCTQLEDWWTRQPLPAIYGGQMQLGCRWVSDFERRMLVFSDECISLVGE